MHRSELDTLLKYLQVRLEAVAVCEIGRGFSLHFGPYDSIVVHHVVSGCGVLEVQGSAPIAFSQDSMLLVPPQRRKRIRVGKEPTIAVSSAEHCSTAPNALPRLDVTGGGAANLVIVCGALHATLGSFGPFDDLTTPLVEDMSGFGAVRVAFRTMLAEQMTPRLGASALCSSLMTQCLLLFIRQHLHSNRFSPLSLALSDERLARALSSILHHRGELCMKELAACAGMSRSAFAKRFKQALHTTPIEFARQTRLQRAAELLESTDLPIKTIAVEAGYASRCQFGRAFRAAFAAHPSSYRRERRLQTAPRKPIVAELAADAVLRVATNRSLR